MNAILDLENLAHAGPDTSKTVRCGFVVEIRENAPVNVTFDRFFAAYPGQVPPDVYPDARTSHTDPEGQALRKRNYQAIALPGPQVIESVGSV
jgi:hypothetical protein